MKIIVECCHLQVDIYLNGRPVEEMSQLTHRDKIRDTARRIVHRLTTTIPQQLFAIAVQAKVGSKIVARDDIRALRKDVLAKCVRFIMFCSICEVTNDLVKETIS